MNGFSIIVCTYNPQSIIFKRLLSALRLLQMPAVAPVEFIIIDNNSSPPVEALTETKEWLDQIAAFQVNIIHEPKPGLTEARIAGIKAAAFDWLVFFDDDNEPASDYILKLDILVNEFKQVGCWGPGKVHVEFINGVATEWALSKKDVFQERNLLEAKIDNQLQWQECYPFGTGLAILKKIADVYISKVLDNTLTLSDRKGKSLASGGDVQLVLLGLKMGYYAGSSPHLGLKHLISKEKTTFKYLLKLAYGTASSNLPAHVQVFNNYHNYHSSASNSKIAKQVYYLFRSVAQPKGYKEFRFRLAHYLGEIEGETIVTKEKKTIMHKLLKKLIL